MKVYLPVSDDAETGKGLFVNRLSKELSKYVKITGKSEKCDIALYLTKIKEKIDARRHVIRYDGIYHNTGQDYLKINSDINKHMKNAQGVIYQSVFSKTMCDKYLGKFNGHQKVIFNGADIEYYAKVKPLNFSNSVNFLTVSRWRPHKRLRDTIECFLLSNIVDSCLWVAGPLDTSGLTTVEIKRYKDKGIKFLGKINQELLSRYYVSCKASLHLCWLDWCPNSVIEAIAAKCLVVSNNIGGTPELVSNSNGIICPIDKEYDFKPVKLYKPPQFDKNIVAEALINLKSRNISNQFIDIKVITKQYLNFFEEVLR
jgi:glycosyltransferase involved in cell wall biosynthesis